MCTLNRANHRKRNVRNRQSSKHQPASQPERVLLETTLQRQHHHSESRRPPPSHLDQLLHANTRTSRLGAAAGSGAIRQRSINQNRVRAVDTRHRDQTFVQVVERAIADNTVDEVGAIVIITATLLVRVAAALDGLRLVLAGGRVVVEPRVAVRVQVRRVVPDSRPEGKRQRADTEEADRREAEGRDAARAVRRRRAAAVVCAAAAVSSWCAGSCRCAAAGGGGGRPAAA